MVRIWRDWNHPTLVADQQNGDALVESSLVVPQEVTRTGTSLAVHWLGLYTSTAGSTSLIPGLNPWSGNYDPHVTRFKRKKKNHFKITLIT